MRASLLATACVGASGNNMFTPSPTVSPAPTTAVFSQRTSIQSSPRPFAAVATISAYPGTSSSVKGTIVVEDNTDGISLIGTLVGLEDSVSNGGIHIHEGVSCATSDDPGSHYWPQSDTYAVETWTSDPWSSTTYSSNANGAASVSLSSVAGFSLGGDYPVAGRVVVVHNSAGTAVGCGALEATSGEVVQLGAYPGYSGTYASAVGTLLVANAASPDGVQAHSTVTVSGTLANVEASSSGFVGVHSGFTCDDAGGVGELYSPSTAADGAWAASAAYTADSSGSATLSGASVAGFTLDQSSPVAFRAVVAHVATGSEGVSCGVLGTPPSAVATLGAYPGSGGSASVQGTVVVQEQTWGSETGITLFGTLSGLNRSAVGGIHIHEGVGCNDTSQPGGHYYFTYSGKNESFVAVTKMELQSSSKVKSSSKADLKTAIAVQLKCSEQNITNYAVSSEQPNPLAPVYTWTASFDVRAALPFKNSSTSKSAEYVAQRLQDDSFNQELNNEVTQNNAGSSLFVTSVDASAMTNDEPGSVDPWLDVTWASDALGGASVSWDLEGFSLAGSLPVAGRVVVVHDPLGARVACGVLESTAGAVVQLHRSKGEGGFEGGLGSANTTGTLVLTQEGGSGVSLSGTVTGADPSQTSYIAVYQDFTCSLAAASLTRLDDSSGSDPWAAATFSADADGAATVAVVGIGGFTTSAALFGTPALYRTVGVAPTSSSSKLSACGVSGQAPGTVVASLAVMPGYSGGLDPTGTVVVSLSQGDSDGRNVRVSGTVAGLQSKAEVSGGVRIKNGTSCAAPGSDYYAASYSANPWAATSYTTDEGGATTLSFEAKGFTLTEGGGWAEPSLPLLVGKVVVVLNRGGVEVACGVLEPTVGEVVTVGAYPGYTGSYADTVRGTVVVAPTETGVSLKGTLAGLEASKTGGIHIHSGFTADDAAGVGGHYYEGDGPDPWLDTTYSTDSDGAATVNLEVANFTLRGSQPVAQRALVVHLSSSSSSARAGAGVISTAAAADTAVQYEFASPSPAPTVWVPDTTLVVVKAVLKGSRQPASGDDALVQEATAEQLSRASGGSSVPNSPVTGKGSGFALASADVYDHSLKSSSTSVGYKWVVRFSVQLSLQRYCGLNANTLNPCTLSDLQSEVQFMLGPSYPGEQYSTTIGGKVGFNGLVTTNVEATAYSTMFPTPAPSLPASSKSKSSGSSGLLSMRENKAITVEYSVTMAVVALGVSVGVLLYRQYTLNPQGTWYKCYQDHDDFRVLGKEQAPNVAGYNTNDDGSFDPAKITGGY